MDKKIQFILSNIDLYQNKVFFKKIANLIKSRLGYKLLTFTVIDKSQTFVERVYTSNNKIYPLMGVKKIPQNEWKKKVIKQKHNFFLNSRERIKEIFYDYDIIFSLGCGSIINYLVLFQGKILGTINILHKEGYYKKKHIKELKIYSNLLISHYINHQNLMKKNNRK